MVASFKPRFCPDNPSPSTQPGQMPPGASAGMTALQSGQIVESFSIELEITLVSSIERKWKDHQGSPLTGVANLAISRFAIFLFENNFESHWSRRHAGNGLPGLSVVNNR